MLALRIALRYLLSPKSHAAVNVISAVSMAGVAVATIAIVCVLSVFNGFANLAYSRVSAVDPDLAVIPVHGKLIDNAPLVLAKTSGLMHVKHALPIVRDQGLAVYAGRQLAVEVIGVPADYDSVVPISRSVIDALGPTEQSEIPDVTMLSVGAAIKLGANPGLTVPLGLYAPRRIGHINAANPMASFVTDSLPIGSVIRTDDQRHDAATVYLPIGTARHLLGVKPDQASAIHIKLEPGVDVANVRSDLKDLLGEDFKVMDRLEQEHESFRMISVEKWITFAMLAFVLVIASFNVVSTLSMLIIEKRHDLITLRSLGASPKLLRRIFMWQGWLVSAGGGVVGILLGSALSLAQQWGGFIKINGDADRLSVTTYPVQLECADLAAVALTVFVLGLPIAYFTSSRAR